MTNKIAIIIIILYTLSPLLYADYAKQLNDIKKKIDAQEQELLSLKSRGDDIVAQTLILEAKMANEKKAIQILQKEINNNNTKIKNYTILIAGLEDQKRTTEQQITRGMIFLTDNAGVFAIRTFLTDTDFNDIVVSNEIISVINSDMAAKIESFNQTVLELEGSYKKLEEANTELMSNLQESHNILNSYNNSKKKLDAQLASIKKNQSQSATYLSALQKEEARLTDIIKSNASKKTNFGEGVFAKSYGKLNLPMKGKIIESFGERFITEANMYIKHNGIKIRPSGDGNVYSPLDGLVCYNDYLNGMGNILIVKYDDDYFMVFANLDEFFVNSGDTVKADELIGRIDVDLKSVSAYLYLEIRYHETAVNPAPWFKK